jgi:HEAT repeat protein
MTYAIYPLDFMRKIPFLLSVLLSLTAVATADQSATPALSVTFDNQRIAAIEVDGQNIVLPNWGPSLNVTYQNAKPTHLRNPVMSLEDGVQTLTYDGFSVVTVYDVKPQLLNFTVTLTNQSDAVINHIDYRPFTLRLPTRPRGSPWNWGYEVRADGDGSPAVVDADWGDAKVALGLLPGSADPAAVDAERPVVVAFGGSQPPRFEYPAIFRINFGQDGLAPGQSWQFTGTLRVAPSGTPKTVMAEEIYDHFLTQYPFILDWPDRRPIGLIFLANSNQKWPTNPRGWLNNPKLDVTTEEGREEFRKQLMALADRSIVQLKAVGAQGVIIWDVEGGEMPHAITYLGDPRVLPEHAPEMDAVADEFFKRFSDAGFSTGVTIRPSKIVTRPATGQPAHQQVENAVDDMADKIDYAKTRWGSTIFYMDTNVTWPIDTRPLDQDLTRGMWQGNATLIPSREMVRLAKMHPDTLIIPEFPRFGYYSAVGVYGETFTGRQVQTASDIRAVYPDAITAWKLGDVDFPVEWEGLLEGSLAGDIYMFRAWFGDRINTFLRYLRNEVDYIKASETAEWTGDLSAGLADDDAIMRYRAVVSIEKPDAAQTALLLAAVESEKDWVVQRRMVLALGASEDPAVIPVLEKLATNPQTHLYAAACEALGAIGAPATPVLLAIAQGDNRNAATSALRALARYDDPAATPVLLQMAQDTARPAEQRALAVTALTPRPSPEVSRVLIELLDGTEAQVLIATCRALAAQNDRDAIGPLVALILRSVQTLKNNHVRAAAGDALDQLTGLQLGTFENQWKRALEEGRLL